MPWYLCAEVDESFFRTAPQVHRYTLDVPVPPEEVWRSLTSDESLAAWGPGARAVRWAGRRPFGVGTTREVELAAGLATVRERFLRWDEGSGYSFYVEAINRPLVSRLAEDYRIEARPGGARLNWVVAVESRPRHPIANRLSAPINRLAFGATASAGRRYFAKRAAMID